MPLQTTPIRALPAILIAALGLSSGPTLAQMSGNPLIGAWTGRSPDGSVMETDIYNPDGSFISTAHFSSGQYAGLTMRIFGRYDVNQTGPNLYVVRTQMAGYLPRRMCAAGSGGANCVAFPPPPLPSSSNITLLDQNTLQSNGMTSQRDGSAMLARMPVPEDASVLVASDPNPNPNPGLPDLCSLGARQCFAGYMRNCERWPNGQANWMTSGTSC